MVHVQTAHMMNIYQLSDPAKVRPSLRNNNNQILLILDKGYKTRGRQT
jgi:hypothetical protein